MPSAQITANNGILTLYRLIRSFSNLAGLDISTPCQ
jgi:hypothetical protein